MKKNNKKLGGLLRELLEVEDQSTTEIDVRIAANE